MTETTFDCRVLRSAVALACRAPSLHNSQPWRWVVDGAVLQLFADRSRIGNGADVSGRQLILSCGAVLGHLRVAMAAGGVDVAVDRFPNPNNRDHIATVDFTTMEFVTEAHQRLADAILRRRTDRLPFLAPSNWETFEPVLRAAIDPDNATMDLVADGARPKLAEASRLTGELRRYDSSYQAELHWWTTPFELDRGIPPASLLSETEAARVDVARAFPTPGYGNRRAVVTADRSKIVVLSTEDDSYEQVLRCGEALSTLLLECTAADLATCTLTHVTELAVSRDIVRRLTAGRGFPQLLVRIGRTPIVDEVPPMTPRRPLSDVLEFP